MSSFYSYLTGSDDEKEFETCRNVSKEFLEAKYDRKNKG